MSRNNLITIAQRLREYVGNPHHIDPMSDAFKQLISDASEALSQAAQPQGEPVADLIRLDRSYRNGLMAGFHFGITGDEKGYAACIQRYNAGIKEAKAEQPAPVAVVLPDSVKVLHRFEGDPISQAQAKGWNACLDEVARLNAAQPVPVAMAHSCGLDKPQTCRACKPAPVAVAGNRTPFEIEHDAEPGDEAAFRQWRQERLNPSL